MNTYEKYKDSGIEWIGEIPEHWRITSLKRFCKVTDGSHYSPKTVESGLPYISVRDIGINTIDFIGCKKISEEDFLELEKNGCRPKQGDILLTKDGTIGRAAIVKEEYEPFVILSSLGLITPNKSFDLVFFYYYLISGINVEQMFSFIHGSALTRLTIEKIKNLILIIPELKEQTAIANYLDRKTTQIDQLIADKKRLVELYQEEKTAIINQAVTKGINPNVKLKDSGIEWLGDIPEHWEVKRLKYIANVQTGRTPKIAGSKIDFFENGTVNWYTPGDFIKGKHLGDSRRKLINEAFDQNQVELFEEYSTYLVSIGATLGKVSLSLEKASANQQINVITFDKENINPFYGYLFILGNSEMILNEADYTTLPILNQSKLNNISFAVSDKKEQTQIVQHIEKKSERIDTKIAKAEQYIKLLTEYRTALISEVVTGKKKVIDG